MVCVACRSIINEIECALRGGGTDIKLKNGHSSMTVTADNLENVQHMSVWMITDEFKSSRGDCP